MDRRTVGRQFAGMLDGVRLLNTGKTAWDELSASERENINAGLDDIKHGRVMSSEEFWDQVKNG